MVVTEITGEGSKARVSVTWFFEGSGEFRDDVLFMSVLKKHAYQA